MISVWEGGIYIPGLAKFRFPSAIWISYSPSPPPWFSAKMKCTMMNSALLGWVFARALALAPQAVGGMQKVTFARWSTAIVKHVHESGSRSQVVHIVGSTHWLPRNCQIGSGCRLSASLEGIQCDQGVVYSPTNPADFFPGMPSTRFEIVQPLECLARWSSKGRGSHASLGKARRLVNV